MFVAVSILLASVVLLAFIVGLVWVVYVPVIAEGLEHTHWLAADPHPPATEGEVCRFPTPDGRSLVGTYLRTAATRRLGVIACCHELTGNRWTLWPYIAGLRQRGFDCFCFDFRNHGESDGTPGYEPQPWLTHYELVDVLAALGYLATREDADRQGVGLFGVSRGGVAALCAAAMSAATQDHRIRAVVADGAFATSAMQVHYIRRYMAIFTRLTPLFSRLPDRVLAVLAWGARRRIERRRQVRYISIERGLGRVRQPVLLIHGADDRLIPLELFDRLANRLPRATRWIVTGARHNGALEKAPAEYEERVADFFVEHLATGNPRTGGEDNDAR